ncbi:MAG: hypothetical protein IKN37_06040 [Bacteroidales bacterium]|jgi:hypothetical protein|nr:hypothetical protein [Bacteroidales bacterium]MBR4339716.1 hypothetical protein [Bacteroidales bacterium]MBR4492479.1 hypothetical protein [Bacteroidales bacterium]MBR6919852.1 hypothetical protein [Bacteroidales bacterium]
MKNKNFVLIQAGLILVILVLIVAIYRSLSRPEKFNEVYEARKAEVIQKLSDIRTLQTFYKNEKGSYAGSFDQLKDFWENGKMRVVVKEGNVPDSMTEAQAIKLKLVRRDTVVLNAKEEMIKTLPNLDINTFDLVPYSGKEQFLIAADTLRAGNVPVQVYEVKALRSQYMKNLDNDPRVKKAFLGKLLYGNMQKQFLGPDYNYKDNVIDLILGSLTEASTNGNWQ